MSIYGSKIYVTPKKLVNEIHVWSWDSQLVLYIYIHTQLNQDIFVVMAHRNSKVCNKMVF